MKNPINGKCAICGQLKKLSKEHIPPKRAFNENTVLLGKIDSAQSKAQLRWKKVEKQGGNFSYVLCEDCNNLTGHWYGSEYVSFVGQCAPFAKTENGGKHGSISITIYPSRVIKQALTIFCASCSNGLSETNPIMRKMILSRDFAGSLDLLRVWLYLRAHEGGRATGVSGVLNVNTSTNQVIAEFSWWPVGWVLSFNDQSIPNLTEVTHWCKYDYNEKKRLIIDLSCHWASTAYPLDFRSPETVLKEAEAQINRKK